MTQPASTHRSRPCGAQSGGDVEPLTTLDRHTGRVALDAPAAANDADVACHHGTTARACSRPAGSRDEKWRPPPRSARGSGEGAPSGETPCASDSDMGVSSSIFPGYSGTKCADDARRDQWLGELAENTRPFRAQRALQHRGKAHLATLKGDHSRAFWHATRARGQLQRFERVAGCRARELMITCDACGTEMHRIEARCSQSRLCLHCRELRKFEYRASIRAGRQQALRATEHLRRPGAPGGEWRERFLTLTIPHSGEIDRDVKAICAAWPVLRKKLWRFFRREHRLTKHVLAQVRFVRVLEMTPGRTNEGHAHFHVYLLSPFVPHQFVRHAWGTTLRALGYRVPLKRLDDVLAEVDAQFQRDQLLRLLITRGGRNARNIAWPVVDLRECYGDVETELVKYLLKDAEFQRGELELISPALAAQFYQALEGVRTIASSRGFMKREGRACFCEECGSTQVSRRMVQKSGTSLETAGEAENSSD